MNKRAPKWNRHPAGKRAVLAVASVAAVLRSTSAGADVNFDELRGVPEQLGLRTLSVDVDWACYWPLLALIVLVVAFVAADRLWGDKLKRTGRDD